MEALLEAGVFDLVCPGDGYLDALEASEFKELFESVRTILEKIPVFIDSERKHKSTHLLVTRWKRSQPIESLKELIVSWVSKVSEIFLLLYRFVFAFVLFNSSFFFL